jgi:hypothetical protein
MVDACASRLKQNINNNLYSKYLLLKKSYIIALSEMPKLQNFEKCCEKAMNEVNGFLGMEIVKCPRTAMKWNRYF